MKIIAAIAIACLFVYLYENHKIRRKQKAAELGKQRVGEPLRQRPMTKEDAKDKTIFRLTDKEA